MRVRRTELTTPGSSLDMMEKAAESDADEVMLDLEDAVAPDEKKDARGKIATAARELDWSGKVLAVRINGLDTRYAYGDLVEVLREAGDAIDVVIVPKIKHDGDVYVVDTLLGQIEADHGFEGEFGMEVLIEETEAMQHVDEIAASSDRLEALIFGPGDYSAAQGVDMDAIGNQDADGDGYPGDVWHYARNRIVIAARSNGLDAIDGPFPDFSDPEGYRSECRRSKILGFDGKWAIHPSQISIANETYAPTDAEVERAQEMVAAMEQGVEAGQGAVQYDGQMLDEASVRSARQTIERARAIGMLE